MSAEPEPMVGYVGINVVLRPNGSLIRIEDIATAEQGRAILLEQEAAISSIERQLSDAKLHGGRDAEWIRRAEMAHKVKRRFRPALQARISELRRAERGPVNTATTSHEDGRRKAFMTAAKKVLPGSVIDDIWAKARELKPELFPEEVQP